ncbi:MAG: lipoyl(octanoyl) transferase LipB [Anaerolineae bacterium]|jgi:lipoate-protein ligase B|nr:lipoyl(octanoyl) transferase LipB [Chloroflexota bacterium]
MSPEVPRPVIRVVDLGLRQYGPVHALQHATVQGVRKGTVSQVLYLVEHTPTITLGRRADPAHILASPETLQRMGIVTCQIERGGDVTYHGPGQLVAYPILPLRAYGLGPSDYMHLLEGCVIGALADLGVAATRRTGLIGVWVGDAKICALGVRILRGVSLHGLALNVDPDMAPWQTIVPCGIHDGRVTSLRQVLGQVPAMATVQDKLVQQLGQALRADMLPVTDVERWIEATMAAAATP